MADLTISIVNTVLSLGGLAGIIVWTSVKDDYRTMYYDGYGLYWFTCVSSSLWGIMSILISVFGYSQSPNAWYAPTLASPFSVIVWVSLFFTAIWIASTAKTASYLHGCIQEKTDDSNSPTCNGEIIATAFGAAVSIVWVFTLTHYFFKFHSVNSNESAENVGGNYRSVNKNGASPASTVEEVAFSIPEKV